jgi:hypothetical protein
VAATYAGEGADATGPQSGGGLFDWQDDA